MYQEVRAWIYKNARAIDLATWKCLFEDGNKDEVVNALMLYQNEDGGFGHGLEPDNWNPSSTPYTTLYAMNLLEQIGFKNDKHPMIQGIIKYLNSGKDYKEYGWCFSIPSNDFYPHAPWWTYNEEDNKIESIGLSAEIGSFVLKYAKEESNVYQKVIGLCEQIIEKLMLEDDLGAMGLRGCIALIEALKEKMPHKYNYDLLEQRLQELTHQVLERDASDWSTYGTRPSDLIKKKDSIYYEKNKELVEREVRYLLETKPEHDVWGIYWTWYHLMETYKDEFIISKHYYKAIKAIERIRFLRTFYGKEL